MGAASSFSIIMPVLNEAGRIHEAIEGVRTLSGGDAVQVIIVDGDPRGSTITRVSDPRVLTMTTGPGRARQMNRGAEEASGDILLFLHADTRLPEQAFDLVRAALTDDRIVGGAFDLGFETTRRIFAVTETYVRIRTRLTRVPFGDQAIFLRRGYFHAIGGFVDIPLMEDVELMKRIRKRGDRIRIISKKVRTSPRRYEREGVLFCTFRNMALQFLYACGFRPDRLAAWYRPEPTGSERQSGTERCP